MKDKTFYYNIIFYYKKLLKKSTVSDGNNNFNRKQNHYTKKPFDWQLNSFAMEVIQTSLKRCPPQNFLDLELFLMKN